MSDILEKIDKVLDEKIINDTIKKLLNYIKDQTGLVLKLDEYFKGI